MAKPKPKNYTIDQELEAAEIISRMEEKQPMDPVNDMTWESSEDFSFDDE